MMSVVVLFRVPRHRRGNGGVFDSKGWKRTCRDVVFDASSLDLDYDNW